MRTLRLKLRSSTAVILDTHVVVLELLVLEAVALVRVERDGGVVVPPLRRDDDEEVVLNANRVSPAADVNDGQFARHDARFVGGFFEEARADG